MAGVDHFSFAGADSLHLSKMSSDGFLSGWAGLAVADVGISSGMRRAKGVQQLPNPIQEALRKTVTGDDGPIRTFQFANAEPAGAQLDMAVIDLVIEAAVQNSAVWALNSLWNIGVRGQSNPTFSNIAILAHSQSASEDSGTAGTAGFKNVLYPGCELLPIGPTGIQFQQEGMTRYSALMNKVTKFPLGVALASANVATLDGLSFEWWSEHRTLFFAAVGNGVLASFVLDYEPVDVAHTLAYVDGVTTPITSVTPATKTVVLTTPPPTGKRVVIMYEVARYA